MIKLKDILVEMALVPKVGGGATDIEDVHPLSSVGSDWDEVLPTNSPIVHEFKRNGINIYAAYVFNEKKKNQSELKRKLRIAVKDTNNTSNIETISKLLNRKVVALKKKGILNDIDFIIPLGSSSDFNSVMSDVISKQSTKAKVLDNFLVKSKWKNVEVVDLGENSKKGYERAKSKLEYMQDPKNGFSEEDFQIKDVGGSQSLRRYFRCFYHIPEGKIDIINDLIGKNILLIDDTFEEGVTMSDAQRVIGATNPGKVQAFVFLYGN